MVLTLSKKKKELAGAAKSTYICPMNSCPVSVTLWLTLLIHGKRFQSDGLAWSRVQGADVLAPHCCDQPSYLLCLFSGCASVMVALFVTSHRAHWAQACALFSV